ncbi:hypothetical protein [Micromonospora humidisoli]|uniref:Saccharopine dehydrogenase NADP binding domain-containing protein n=1 Tax=Micromonospora humidisoli TaxID=2807622 RepID=A0ABS2JLI0_9ACTN|nr:hypothetical protein [Micromonospora humidisoli]MBM7086506.1 hypothetical protein [Micromonospora humidisoli]
MTDVWILGGTGRSGRAIAAELRRRNIEPVLVGRDAERLEAAAGGLPTMLAGTVRETVAAIRREQPAVVVNTVGPFIETALPLLDACLPTGHYLDLANDLASVSAVLGRHGELTAAGRTAVTGAGFGVTATESVVVKLCQGQPTPRRVRVDMVPSLATEDGVVGDALAATIVEGIPGVEDGGRFQGRRYRDGRLAPARLGSDPMKLVLPDGSTVTTAGMPLGELMAAQRASGAADVLAASSEAPSSPVMRAVLPVATALLAIGPVRALLRRRLATVATRARPKPREHSWGHAVVEWPDGSIREGWLRVGEAQSWTATVPAEVVRRLLDGQGKPGAYTPAALFGSTLAEACGGAYQVR